MLAMVKQSQKQKKKKMKTKKIDLAYPVEITKTKQAFQINCEEILSSVFLPISLHSRCIH